MKVLLELNDINDDIIFDDLIEIAKDYKFFIVGTSNFNTYIFEFEKYNDTFSFLLDTINYLGQELPTVKLLKYQK